MSHEFRTPLNAILSLSQLLLERLDGELNSEQEKQVNFIRTSALGLSELVNDLLDIAKVEAGKVTIRPQQFEVSDLFNALKGILRPLLNQSEVNLFFDKPQNLPMCTDEGKVSQILRNLISNALKFTPKGEIRVSALQQERTVVFTVADTGIGIAPNDLELIFEEFVQIENPLQSQFKGTGLGLPLCRQLAQLLGGKIAVESKLEVGSIFTVTLPCVYAEVKEALPQTPIKVLIIDDQEISRYLLKGLLKSHSIKVTEAINGSEGVLKAILEQPQVIFLDLVMPELSGFEVLEQLKANPTTKQIPVIIHTSKQLEPEERDHLINAKVVAILSKDLDRPDAEAIIHQVLLKAGLHLNL